MIKFYVKSRQNPINQNTKFYAQIASPEPVSIETIAKQIAAGCTLTRHDILACLSSFQEQLINALQDGKSVRLSDLGSFRVSLSSDGTDTKEAFSASKIKGVSIIFAPSARLRKATALGADGMSLSMINKGEPTAAEPQDPGAGGDMA